MWQPFYGLSPIAILSMSNIENNKEKKRKEKKKKSKKIINEQKKLPMEFFRGLNKPTMAVHLFVIPHHERPC